MHGAVHRRVAVDDQLGMGRGVFVKLLADPQQVILGLIIQRHPGADTRMGKEVVGRLMRQREGFQEIDMRLRYRFAGLCMNV